MKKILLLISLLICLKVCSQQILWSKPTVFNNSRGLVTDNTGNLYHYGSKLNSWYSNSVDTAGSFIQKFSASGALLFSKRWPGSFWIKNIIYDGVQYFYFTGTFSGSYSVNGISISSKGNEDGMVGRMDQNGTISWISTMGASGLDNSNAITFNKSKNKIVVTGSLTDSLFVNKNFISFNAQKTLLLAGFSLTGNLLDFKMIDFLIERNYGNSGSEIKTDTAGNYIMVGSREGKFWNGDTLNAPDEGVYVFKLDQNYNISWSKFIINSGCYYGYSYGGICVADNCDSYMPSFCSGKYGGNGVLQRFGSTLGNVGWTGTNTDGSYAETFAHNGNALVIGTEAANGCPCEGNQPGYQVIKKLNKNNQVIGETRLFNVRLTHLTRSAQGTIFVSGVIYGAPYAVIGHDTVHASSSQGWFSGTFITALSDIPCTPPVINNVEVPYLTQYICPLSTATLDAGSGYTSYLWSNGATTQKINVSQNGSYSVRVTEATGCQAYSLPTRIEKKVSAAPKLMNVSYNKLTNRNTILWLNQEYGVSKFKIYKWEGSGDSVLTAIYTPTNAYEMVFTDSLSFNDTSAAKYKVTAIDTCGTESFVSNAQKAMFLKINQNHAGHLEWNKYEGFTYTKFYVLRGTTVNNLSVIDSTAIGQTTYAPNNSTQNFYYQIKVQTSPNNMYYTSYSNVVLRTQGMANQKANSVSGFKVDLFPNPTAGIVNINIESRQVIGMMDVKIRNINGEPLEEHNFNVKDKLAKTSVNLSAHPKGVYFIEIIINKKSEIRRVILN
ncbi:MAG: hypothetical protein JWO32_2320 [Bacteroidetes bacterium]|nr:hypothetical protein [Bacteroidota bacterium]